MNPLLVLHITGGAVALLTGAAALAARKGGPLHRASGLVFVGAMLTMATAATALSATLPDWSNLPGGLFAFYLVITGWTTVRPPPRLRGLVDGGALALGLAVAATSASFAVLATRAADHQFYGKAAPIYMIFAGLALLAAGLDAKVLLAGGLAGPPRLARHLWRMTTALFFATGSFFLGQQKVMPAWLHGSPVLIVLALAPLPVMLVWLVLVRRPRRAALAAA